jgi:hypothetical protein
LDGSSPREAVLGAPDDTRIGDTMSVDAWMRLLECAGLGPIDVLLRDADQVILGAPKTSR